MKFENDQKSKYQVDDENSSNQKEAEANEELQRHGINRSSYVELEEQMNW